MEDAKPKWFKERKYLHFDRPISLKKATALVASKGLIAKHSFYPLIGYVVESKKLTKDTSSGKLVLLPKSRPIKYASHIDSAIYSYYANQIGNLYECKLQELQLENVVLAFRASLGVSNIEFAKLAFDEIKRRGDCSVVALDISGFFDNLDHAILKERWCELLGKARLPDDHYAVFNSITKYSEVDKLKLYDLLDISVHNPKHDRDRICSARDFRDIVRKQKLISTNVNPFGIPQGTPISALLSNVYMLGFDKIVHRAVSEIGGCYLRYCDDMLFIVGTEFRDGIAGFVRKEISNLKIDINPQKTEIRTFQKTATGQTCDNPLQYLGFTFDGSRILIRSAALARYSEKMRRGVKLAKLTKKKHDQLRALKGLPPEPIYKKKIYSRYSHLGGRNFLTYGYRASRVMCSKAIRKQLKPLWSRLRNEIED